MHFTLQQENLTQDIQTGPVIGWELRRNYQKNAIFPQESYCLRLNPAC